MQTYMKIDSETINWIKTFIIKMNMSYNKFVTLSTIRTAILINEKEIDISNVYDFEQEPKRSEYLHLYINDVIVNVLPEEIKVRLTKKFMAAAVLYTAKRLYTKFDELNFKSMSLKITSITQDASKVKLLTRLALAKISAGSSHIEILQPEGTIRYNILIQPGEWAMVKYFNPEIDFYDPNKLISGMITKNN